MRSLSELLLACSLLLLANSLKKFGLKGSSLFTSDNSSATVSVSLFGLMTRWSSEYTECRLVLLFRDDPTKGRYVISVLCGCIGLVELVELGEWLSIGAGECLV
jgi:hypothetical protein